MKKVLTLLTIFCLSFAVFTACSNDDDSDAVSLDIPVDDDPLPPPPPNPEIRVVLSSETVTAGATVAFSAFSDQEGNVTTNTTFYVNNAPIEGNTYTTTSAGTFTIKGQAPNYTESAPVTLTVNPVPEPEPEEPEEP